MKNINPSTRAEEIVTAMLDTLCPVKRGLYVVDAIIEQLYYDTNGSPTQFNYWLQVREEMLKIDLESQELL